MTSLLLFVGLASATEPIRATTAPGLTVDALSAPGDDVLATFQAPWKGKTATLAIEAVAPAKGEAAPSLVVLKGDKVVGTATSRYANQEVSYLVDLGTQGVVGEH